MQEAVAERAPDPVSGPGAGVHPGRGVLAVLLVHQALLWAAVLTGNPQATVTWDCVAGSMAEDALRGWAFSPLDSFDGVLGGMFLASLVGLPLFKAVGVTGLAVKGVSVTLAGAVVAGAGLVWARALGPRAGMLAAAAVAFLPPVAFIASLILGNWHFTEVGFELALTGVLLGVIWGRGRGDPLSVRWALGTGVLAGLAVFNCFATAVFLPALYAVGWATSRSRASWRSAGAHAAGLLVGLAPLWFKVLVHQPYGIAGGGSVRVPPEATNVGLSLGKLVGLVDGAFQQGLHFDTALSTPAGSFASSGLAGLASAALLLGWALLALRVSPSMLALVRGCLPGREASADEVSPAAIPVLMAAIFLVALLASDMNLRHVPWYLSNPRDHDHIVLIPWLAQLALCGALLADSLRYERTTGTVRGGELGISSRLGSVIGALPIACVVLAGMIGLGAFVVPDAGTPRSASAFRGSCWDVKGFMLAPHLGLEFESGRALCEEYGEQQGWECSRGVAWAVGYFGVEAYMEESQGTPAAACQEMPDPWRAECLRGVGWGLSSGGGGDVSDGFEMAGVCDALSPAEDARWCWRGVGFPIGDHLGSSPERLRRAMEDLPVNRRADVAEGAGALLGRTYSAEETAQGLCAQWGEDLAASCMRGVQDSRTWASSARTR